MYSFQQSEQLKFFLLSLGVGFALGIAYDILRTIRLTISKSKTLIFIFDVLYFLIFGFATFIFFLAINKGELRGYMLFGEVLGWVFYYVSFGLAAKTFTDKFVKIFHAIFKFVFKVVSAPFRLIFKVILTFKNKFLTFSQKVVKKTKKNSKKHLQKQRLYVYNLLGIFKKQQNVKKKGGANNEQQKKSEKES
jgi:spore cortex biosynthesis protein YabQ